jgi:hypothetical protein
MLCWPLISCGLLTPLGVAMRLARRDVLCLRKPNAARSRTSSVVSSRSSEDRSTMADERSREAAFAREAERRQAGVVGEFWISCPHDTKWWLTPIVLMLLLGVLIVLGGTAAAPFIYTLS